MPWKPPAARRTEEAVKNGGTPSPPKVSNDDSEGNENVNGLKMVAKEKVWLPHPTEGFLLGTIIDFAIEGAVVQPVDRNSKPITSVFDRLYPAEDDDNKEVDDNCGLMYLNEATLLNNVKLRYQKGKIYTYVANILIAVNPYYNIPDLYSTNTIRKYMGKSLGTLPPHIFAIADKAFRDMKVMKQSQSIIVSGESGAGKTESTKYILNYLCTNFGQSAGSLESKILNANPILEAFGNAKTTRNNNSSRFGKFIEIHFDSKCQVAGGYISHYLLERARVISQSPMERNYHVFYQLCAGADDALRKKLKLGNPDQFRYLANGCTQYFLSKESQSSIPQERLSAFHKKKGSLSDDIIDDIKGFNNLNRNLGNIGLNDQERLEVFTTIAAVLHIGNIAFEEDPEDNKGGCTVTQSSESSLQITSQLLGLDPDELRRALTARVMQAVKGGFKGTVIMVPLKVHEANSARDALAKSLYSRLFDYIVMKINESIPFKSSSYYIGVLDIAGFEYFAVNSYEQFCINYCNEKLQQFFNQRILKDEQELYQKEGLGVKNVKFVDNQDCIDLYERRVDGIFSILDEVSKLPKPSYQQFTNEVHSRNKNQFRLDLARKSKLKEHREIRDDDGFLIRHFAGAVCYQTMEFIEKNNDALHASLEGLVQECNNRFIMALFNMGSADTASSRGKLNFISVGSKFKSQLGELMDKLESTGTNFIRCIKPNVSMVAKKFEGGSILSQLQCAGMTSVLELMQQGYPSRTQFGELYTMYKQYLPPELARLDPRLFCKALFKALGLNDHDFKFGMTKVFFRPGKFAEFDQLMKADPENLRVLISKVKKWLVCSQWRKAQWCALSIIKLKNKIEYRRAALLIMQKTVRMHLAKKKHRPRIKALVHIKSLSGQVQQIASMASGLKSDKDSVMKAVQKLNNNIEKVIHTIKHDKNIKKKEMDKLYQGLVDEINHEISSVKKKIEKQKAAEEQLKLKKLQEEMERERKRKEAEEAELRRLADERRMKAEMEARRKEEDERQRRQEERDRQQAEKMQAELDNANLRIQQQMEQERRDHELALRLATETGSGVEDMPVLKRSSLVTAHREAAANKKYDLSKWKYAELRDTINTSCDIELLEACKEEFHRRLKVYHAWKARNRRKDSTFDEAMRAPSSILKEASRPTMSTASRKTAAPAGTQRFFRIPFIRQQQDDSPDGATVPQNKGWWFAHFDGDWICRQMELHPGRAPVLLVAGKDDMQMCELSLEETGLTRKRGAEILATEFEKEWSQNGGEPFNKSMDRKRYIN